MHEFSKLLPLIFSAFGIVFFLFACFIGRISDWQEKARREEEARKYDDKINFPYGHTKSAELFYKFEHDRKEQFAKIEHEEAVKNGRTLEPYMQELLDKCD